MLVNEKNLLKAIDQHWSEIWGAAKYIFNNPELGGEEHKAVEYLTGLLEEWGFTTTKGYLDLPTSFKATIGVGKPAIYFLAEYDALPQIGHGCGHHLIAGASVGAALALASIKEEWSGQIVVVGSPAEETQGAKVLLAQKGAFQDCSAAMLFHPGQSAVINITSQALEALEVSFLGSYGHSAGKVGLSNPIVSLVDFYQQTVEYNKSYNPTHQIQGVIVEGGNTPNLIPEKAVGKFYLRALTVKELEKLINKFKAMAEKAAKKNHTQVKIAAFEPRYLPMQTNLTLTKAFAQASQDLGLPIDMNSYQIIGSIDMGNVSWQVPAIHPYLPLSNEKITAHTPLFAQKAGGPEGEKIMAIATKALALTAYRLLQNPILIEEMWQEHRR